MRTFHDCEQRSDEWKQLRRGKFTSSGTQPFMLERPKFRWTKDEICESLEMLGTAYKKSAKHEELAALLPINIVARNLSLTQSTKQATESLICDKLAELMGCPIDEPRMPWWVQRGNEMEPQAREEFELMTGIAMRQVGFVTLDGYRVGDSPDGISEDEEECLEIKVPLDKTHIGYLRAGVLPDEHRLQVAHHLAVTGCKACHFWSWNPNPLVPPFHIRVKRDQFAEEVLDALKRYSDLLDAAKAEYMDVYTAWRTERAKARGVAS